MASDYNAQLIADLYATDDSGQATRICDEMMDIGDPIFPLQIYEAYKKFQKTHRSHYFVGDLTQFKTADVSEILKEIAVTTQRDADITTMLDYLADIEFFDSDFVNKVMTMFETEIESGDILEWDILGYFVYLEKAQQNIDVLADLLQRCFEDNRQSLDVRRNALQKLLKLDAKKYIQLYYDNYKSIQGTKAEVILTKVISTWKGGLVPQLHKKILSEGAPIAKEILEKVQKQKEKDKSTRVVKEQQDLKTEYVTADVIGDIAALRAKINKISMADDRFGFPFFAPSEEFYQQTKPAKDKIILIGCCMNLRSHLNSFDQKIKDFEISLEEAKKLIPDIEDIKGNINKFHLLLLDRGIEVTAISKLRNINRIINKFAAHTDEESDKELIKILKEEDLFDNYVNDQWAPLHRELLLRYKNALDAMQKDLEQ